MVRANSDQLIGVSRYRGRFVAVAVVVVLAAGGLVAGCSTGGGGGLSSACQSARQRFSKALDAEFTADAAMNHTQNRWTNANPATLQGQALSTAISQYSADLQAATAARAKAAQQLAGAKKAISACSQSRLPKACRGEFAQFTPIIANTTSAAQAETAITQAIAAEQQARLSNNAGAFNSAVDAQNAAVAHHNDFTNTFNVTLREAFNAAVPACNKVAPGGTQASTMPPALATTTLALSAPTIVRLAQPCNSSSTRCDVLELAWTAVVGATNYHVVADERIAKRHVERDYPANTTSTADLLRIQGEDTICVVVTAVRGTERAASAERCLVVGEPPGPGGPQSGPGALGAPTISVENQCAPVNPALTTCTITAHWTSVSSATGYRLVADSQLHGQSHWDYPADRTSATQTGVGTGDYICIRVLALRGSESSSSAPTCVSTGVG